MMYSPPYDQQEYSSYNHDYSSMQRQKRDGDDEEILASRKCTDKGSLAIAIMFIMLAIWITATAVSYGDSTRLYKGQSYNGKICGIDDDVRDLSYLYIPLDPNNSKLNLLFGDATCIKSCPSETDVAAKTTLPIRRREVYTDPGKSSVITMQYDLWTLVYSTSLYANSYCVPMATKLKNQWRDVYSRWFKQINFGINSLASAWNVILTAAAVGWAAAMLSTWMLKVSPSATGYSSMLLLVLVGLIHGLTCSISVTKTTFTKSIMGYDAVCTFLWGITVFLFSIVVGFVIFYTPMQLRRAKRVLDITGDTLADMPGIFAISFLNASIVFLFAWFWLVIFLLICSYAMFATQSVDGDEMPITTDAIPPFKITYYPSFGGCFMMLLWIIFLMWGMELIKSITQFVTSYTGTVWYFAPPEGSDSRDVGWCPALVALSVGLGNHFGSLALGAMINLLLAPISALCSWSSSRHDCNPDTSVIALTKFFRPLMVPSRHIVDRISTSGYVEMSISSFDYSKSMRTSSKRLSLFASPVARLSRSASCFTTAIKAAITVTIVWMSHITLTTSKAYVSEASESLIYSPLVVTLFIAIFVWNIVSQYMEVWSSLADSLLYCYLVESTDSTGRVDENPSDKTHAQPRLRDLILETLDEFETPIYPKKHARHPPRGSPRRRTYM